MKRNDPTEDSLCGVIPISRLLLIFLLKLIELPHTEKLPRRNSHAVADFLNRSDFWASALVSDNYEASLETFLNSKPLFHGYDSFTEYALKNGG